MDLFLLGVGRGIVIGFSIAAPVGPIGVLCIRRTLVAGRSVGLVSGLGAASADAAYGAVAALGLTAVTSWLVSARPALHLVGGLFLCYLGVRTLLTKPPTRTPDAPGTSLTGAYASTFALTLTNPATILSFAAIFAGLGAASGHGSDAALMLVAGVFLGSSLWWLLLSGGVSLFRERFNQQALRWVNGVSGATILMFGLLALTSLAM